MRELVRFRLEVESMRHQVECALVDHEKLLQSEVNRAVDEYLASGFKAEIREMVHSAVRQQIAGAIRSAVTQALYRIAPTMERIVGHAVDEALRGVAAGEEPSDG